MKVETKCIHEGYKPENGAPLALPIYQSTTYAYDSTEHIGKLFDLQAEGHMYSRISNPTVAYVEEKIAALEGGVAAVCMTSGQTASFLSLFNILGVGDSFLCSSHIYGGTINLFSVTMKRMGIECIYFDEDMPDDQIEALIKPNTKAIFSESLANPALSVCDISRIADIAHRHGMPLIVDNTFPTPVLCRPLEHGADIVIHSTTKYMDGHAVQVGGVVVDGGTFDWEKNGYTCLSEPDESYHGVIYTKSFGKAAYATKLRTQLIRDFGTYPPASAAFLLDLGLQSLAVRMEKHSANAIAAAKFLQGHDMVESVSYPGLDGDKYNDLAKKYLPNGCSGVVSFTIKGGKANAIKFMDGLKLAKNVVHVATVHTCVLHPASETHRQLTDEQLLAAGINPGMIRLSVGIENIDDILEDLKLGLAQCE